MGAYWGSRYVAVTAELETSRVEQVDLRPIGVSGTSDDLICPVPEHLEGYQLFDHPYHAEKAVRRHIWCVANEQILELVAGLEYAKLRREFIRDIEPESEENQRSIEALTASMAEMTEELKRVRGIKRARIRVV